MNAGYRRAIPYAADDTPDRLWAGSGPVRWIMRSGKPVTSQCETASQVSVEQRSVSTTMRLPLSHRPLESVCGHERICFACKTHFQSNSKKTAKWCPACRLKRQKHKQAEWEKKHRTGQNTPPKPRTCARCGAEHTSPSYRNHCKSCQIIHHREQARKRAAERREEAKGIL